MYWHSKMQISYKVAFFVGFSTSMLLCTNLEAATKLNHLKQIPKNSINSTINGNSNLNTIKLTAVMYNETKKLGSEIGISKNNASRQTIEFVVKIENNLLI